MGAQEEEMSPSPRRAGKGNSHPITMRNAYNRTRGAAFRRGTMIPKQVAGDVRQTTKGSNKLQEMFVKRRKAQTSCRRWSDKRRKAQTSCRRCSSNDERPKQVAGDGSTNDERPKQVAGDGSTNDDDLPQFAGDVRRATEIKNTGTWAFRRPTEIKNGIPSKDRNPLPC